MRYSNTSPAARHFNEEIGFFEPFEGSVMPRSQADDLAWFARQLCAAPFEAEVVNPPVLRSHVAALAARLLRMARFRLICCTPFET